MILNKYSPYNKSRILLTNTFFKTFHSFLHSFLVLLAWSIVLSSGNLFGQQHSDSTKRWMGTWSTAEQLVEPGNMPPSPGLTNNSLRQVVRVSALLGELVRDDDVRIHDQGPGDHDALALASR